MEFSNCGKSYQLKAINYFRKVAPLYMFDRAPGASLDFVSLLL